MMSPGSSDCTALWAQCSALALGTGLALGPALALAEGLILISGTIYCFNFRDIYAHYYWKVWIQLLLLFLTVASYFLPWGERIGCTSEKERELVYQSKRKNWLYSQEDELAVHQSRRKNWLYISQGGRTGCISVKEEELAVYQSRRKNWLYISRGGRTGYISVEEEELAV